MKFVVLFLALLLSTFSIANEKLEITWTRWDLPPLYITSGKYENQGVLDRTEAYIQSLLPSFSHQRLQTTISRTIKLSSSSDTICNAGWINDHKWEKQFYLSTPYSKALGNGVILKYKDFEALNSPKVLSLSKLVTSSSLRGAISKRYEPQIESIFAKSKRNIERLSSQKRAFIMLSKGRLDYLLGFPIEINFYTRFLEEKENFIYVPLKENSKEVEIVFACNKTRAGRKVISSINNLLKNQLHKSKLKQIISSLDHIK